MYEGDYEVSNLGRVRSLNRIDPVGRRVQGKLLRNSVGNRGYPVVTLTRLSVSRNLTVHSLVATVFVGPKPSDAHEVNHIDGNKKNCRASNLEWVTPAGNHRHAEKTGLKRRDHGSGRFHSNTWVSE